LLKESFSLVAQRGTSYAVIVLLWPSNNLSATRNLWADGIIRKYQFRVLYIEWPVMSSTIYGNTRDPTL